MVSRNRKKFYLICILGLLTAVGPFSIDMYLPAFPDIARTLNTNVSEVMLSLSSFFVGIAAGQLIYGPLLERFGRKRPLYFGLSIYIASSVACAMATSVEALILFRLLQALGGCAGMVAARAIVRDLFEVKENAKIFSLLMLVVAVSPIIAPTAGGYVTAALSWRYVFFILLLMGVVILLGVHFILPESKKPDPHFSLKPQAIFKTFFAIIKHPQFYTYTLTGAVAYGGLTAYISGSPHAFMELFRVSEKQYGWIFALVAVGIISASQINNLALRKFSSSQILKAASLCQSIVGIMLVSFVVLQWSTLYVVIVFIFLFLGCHGFIFPNASALSLASFGHVAGSASALMGAIQMGLGAGVSALVSVFQNDTLLPMAGAMASCAVLAFSFLTFGRKMILQQASKEGVQEEDVDLVSTL